MKILRVFTLVFVLALLAGCGSKSKPKADPGQALAQDAAAKASARTLETGVEACFADSQDYTACRDAQLQSLSLGVKFGTGPGQATVSAATPTSYTIVGHSASGARFTIAHSGSGAFKRTCTAASGGGGGCRNGTW
ncbi:MAG: hypothetical protein LC713_02705 [Actinobacteria bacterium]|nr:hypothetical protein [Actinomycetota bacterium]